MKKLNQIYTEMKSDIHLVCELLERYDRPISILCSIILISLLMSLILLEVILGYGTVSVSFSITFIILLIIGVLIKYIRK